MTQVKTLQIQQRMRKQNGTSGENSRPSTHEQLENNSDENLNASKEKKKTKWSDKLDYCVSSIFKSFFVLPYRPFTKGTNDDVILILKMKIKFKNKLYPFLCDIVEIHHNVIRPLVLQQCNLLRYTRLLKY